MIVRLPHSGFNHPLLRVATSSAGATVKGELARSRERRLRLALSALGAKRHELAAAVAPVTPLLGDRGELVDLAVTLGAGDVFR